MALKGPLYSKGSTHCTQRPSVTGTAHSCPVLVTANAHKHGWFCTHTHTHTQTNTQLIAQTSIKLEPFI